jgi:hypothetical protein
MLVISQLVLTSGWLSGGGGMPTARDPVEKMNDWNPSRRPIYRWAHGRGVGPNSCGLVGVFGAEITCGCVCGAQLVGSGGTAHK